MKQLAIPGSLDRASDALAAAMTTAIPTAKRAPRDVAPFLDGVDVALDSVHVRLTNIEARLDAIERLQRVIAAQHDHAFARVLAAIAKLDEKACAVQGPAARRANGNSEAKRPSTQKRHKRS
jgi:hypothetical protein